MSNGVDFRKLAVDLRGQLTTAKSDLAALREELANLGTYNYKLNAQYERMCESHLAAEQRNSELSALLSRAQKFAEFVHKCVRKNGEYAPLHWQEMVEIDRDLSAALKPTESGASENKCCDRFPKCVCYEGADGL